MTNRAGRAKRSQVITDTSLISKFSDSHARTFMFLTNPWNGLPPVFLTEAIVAQMWCAPCGRLVGVVRSSETIAPAGKAIVWAEVLCRPREETHDFAALNIWTQRPIFLHYADSPAAEARGADLGAVPPTHVSTACPTHGEVVVSTSKLLKAAERAAVKQAASSGDTPVVVRVKLYPASV